MTNTLIKLIRVWCWLMFALWLSAKAIQVVMEIYDAGVFWRIPALIIICAGLILWGMGISRAFTIIHADTKKQKEAHNENND